MANLTRRERFGKTFGGNLKKHRNAQGLSLKDLEKSSKIDIGNISKIERGVITPRVDTAARLAKALKVGLDSLVE